MNLPTNILGLIVSYLDRVYNLDIRDVLVENLSEDEKKEVDVMWLKETVISSRPQKGMMTLFMQERWVMNGLLHREVPFGKSDDDYPTITYHENKREWYSCGYLHRNNDKPAQITEWSEKWYQHGKKHRDTGPACVSTAGTMEWYQHDKRHMTDIGPDGKTLPAIIFENGDMNWYRNGLLHRDDRDEKGELLPAIIWRNNVTEWWINDEHLKSANKTGVWKIRNVTIKEVVLTIHIDDMKELARKMGYKKYTSITDLRKELLDMFAKESIYGQSSVKPRSLFE